MAHVSEEIFNRRFTGTPDAITPAITDLAKELSPERDPVWVPVKVAEGAVVRECFVNVRTHVQKFGGRQLNGWAVWEWRRVFLEAEHHCVWVGDEGLVDVTPNEAGSDRILFLPDPTREYDHEGHRRLVNAKRPLNDAREIANWIAASDRLHEFIEANSDGPSVRLDGRGQREMDALGERAVMTQLGVILWLARNTRRNEQCICRSGKKFKVCCMRLLQP
jgi:hypothetical protein